MGVMNKHLISSVISSILSLLLYIILRYYNQWFISTQLNTIFAGFVSSWIFLFNLTAVSNIEMQMFGEDFAARFLPEILFCLIIAAVAAGSIHRVCVTTCILFSILSLYFLDRISNIYYNKVFSNTDVTHRKGASRKSNPKW